MQPLQVNVTNTALAWADDLQGGWKKMFNVTQTPATFLVNAEGKIAWQAQGLMDTDQLAKGLEENLTPGGALDWQMVKLAVKEGDAAPDFLFEYEAGREMALRKLRGRPLLLNFWRSWATPCLEELRDLQLQAQDRANEELLILAINDGEAEQTAADLFKQNDLSLQLVADPTREIAAQYGVSCWPTTVSINASGYIDGIQFGISPHVKAARKKAPK